MKYSVPRHVVLLCVLAVGISMWGCAKKAVETPPAPPQPPAQETPPTPPKPPEPKPEPPAPKPLSESDFQPAFFDFDSYVLRSDARSALDADAKLMRDNASVKITVEGHCDERGTVEYNLALGERRAQAARDYLVNAGIDAGRIKTVSYGKERPFDPGHDEAAWAKNRRAQLVIQ
jgi:peptidoglycan-associated lipoprotein